MFFDLGAGELLGLAILAMLLVGPERLPKIAVDAAQWVKKLRGLANRATTELRDNLGPGFEDLQPKDLNPKTFVKKQILILSLDGLAILKIKTPCPWMVN